MLIQELPPKEAVFRPRLQQLKVYLQHWLLAETEVVEGLVVAKSRVLGVQMLALAVALLAALAVDWICLQ